MVPAGAPILVEEDGIMPSRPFSAECYNQRVLGLQAGQKEPTSNGFSVWPPQGAERIKRIAVDMNKTLVLAYTLFGCFLTQGCDFGPAPLGKPSIGSAGTALTGDAEIDYTQTWDRGFAGDCCTYKQGHRVIAESGQIRITEVAEPTLAHDCTDSPPTDGPCIAVTDPKADPAYVLPDGSKLVWTHTQDASGILLRTSANGAVIWRRDLMYPMDAIRRNTVLVRGPENAIEKINVDTAEIFWIVATPDEL